MEQINCRDASGKVFEIDSNYDDDVRPEMIESTRKLAGLGFGAGAPGVTLSTGQPKRSRTITVSGSPHNWRFTFCSPCSRHCSFLSR